LQRQQAARLNGTVVTIVSTFAADLAPMHEKGLNLHVVFMLVPMLHDIGRRAHGAILREVSALVDAGRLRLLIDAEPFSRSDVSAAHARLESGRAAGKIVVDVG
jgi:NADPH:quinone reductase-like Zn-dependent oxidoreductase